MALRLPDFGESHAVNLTVCGHFTDNANLPEIGERREETARIRPAAGAGFIRSIVSSNHVHFDYTLKSFFRSDFTPKVSGTRGSVLRTVEVAFGKEVSAGVFADFDLPAQALPERGLIRAMSVETKAGPMSAKLVEGRFSIQGVPIVAVSWRFLSEKNGKVVRVRIEGERTVVVSETYLLESWEWIRDQLRALILEK